MLHQLVAAALDQTLELALFLQRAAGYGFRLQFARQAHVANRKRERLAPNCAVRLMRMNEQRVVRLLRSDRSALAVEQTHHIGNIVLELQKLGFDGDFHSPVPRSQAIFVFMPWPG